LIFSSSHDEKQRDLAVVSRAEVGENIIELEFAAADGADLPTWEAGAHIDLKLANGLTRQYSLMEGIQSSSNWRIAVLIEQEGRGGSSYIGEHVHVGLVVGSVGPRNHFSLTPAPRYRFIAGGIGVTPLLKMVAEAEGAGIPWTFAYLGRSPETMAYGNELVARYGDRVVLYPKSTGVRCDIVAIVSELAEDGHVYCCGPERLMVAVESALGESGANRVHVERFHPRELHLDGPDRPFQVYFQKSDVELTVDTDESILMVADFDGIETTGDCMEGTCGSCETRVISGLVDHRDSVLSAQARAEGDTMMICVSRAQGARLVIDL
jgi:ferredoxin-NADP reductase